MKKVITIFILLASAFFISGFTFSSMVSPLTGPVYQNIKEQAVASFSGMFSGKVTIGSAGGVVIGQIVLRDVRIGSDIRAQKIVIDFNPIEYAKAKGDVVPAITTIRVIGGKANIIRKKNGDINALHFLKPAKPGESAVPFKAKLVLEDCRANYLDEGGLPYRKRDHPFGTELSNIRGIVDLVRPPKVKLDLYALQAGSQIHFNGDINQENNQIALKLVARDLDLSNWGTYVVPYLDVKKGRTNLVLDISNDRMDVQLAGAYEKASFTVSGQVVNRLDLSVSIKNADLKSLKEMVPDARNIDLSGSGDMDLTIAGPYDRIGAKVSAAVSRAEIYGQKFSGNAKLDYADRKLSLTGSNIYAYGGNLVVSGEADLSSAVPVLKLTSDLRGLDLNQIANRSPVVSGRISGKAEATGRVDDLTGYLKSDLTACSVFGQPIDSGEASFSFKNGELKIDSIDLISEKARLSGSGSLSSDRWLKLTASAKGILLKGTGIMGDMQAKVNDFNGSVAFRLDDEFIKAPLKKLIASGTTEVSDIMIGDQVIDRAAGGITLYEGKIDLINSYLMKGSSIVYIAGEAGANIPTSISLSGNRIQLSDLKIINAFLPGELRNPSGTLDIDVKVGGKLDKLNSPEDLLNLSIRGKIAISNGNFGGMALNRVYLDAAWENREIKIQDLNIGTARSEIAGRYLIRNGSIEAQLTGNLDFDDFSPVTKRAGIISGLGKVSLSLKGDPRSPQGTATISMKGMRYNSIQLQSIDGAIENRGAKLTLSRPIVIVADKEDQLKISGGAVLGEELNKSDLKLELQLEKGNIIIFADLVKNIYMEASKFSKTYNSGPISIDTGKIGIWPPIFSDPAYHEGKYGRYLKYFEKVSSEVSDYQKKYEIPALMKMTGSITGKLKISGTIENPTAELVSYIYNGSYGNYNFDLLSANAMYSGGTFIVKGLSIMDGNGRADIWGTISHEGGLNLKATAQSLPLNIIRIAVDKKFDGWLDLTSDIEGTVKAPQVTSIFKGSRVGLAGINFDEFSGQAAYNAGVLSVNGFKLIRGKDISLLDGYLDIGKQTGHLRASLEGEAVGLVNLFSDDIEWRGGRSEGILDVDLKHGRLGLKGYLNLTEADFYIKKIDSDLYSVNLTMESDGKELLVSSFRGTWFGKSSRYKQNSLSATGSFDFDSGHTQWLLADTHLNLDFPDLYKGEAQIGGLSLIGDPGNLTVKGKIDLNDGILSLPKGVQSGGSGPAIAVESPVKFYLLINLNKNMYLTAGDVMTLDLSNLFMNLEMAGQGLQFTGSVADPKLSGKVSFKRGTVNILNREFSLLSEDEQKQYYPYDLSQVSGNYAQFGGEGVMPTLRLSAMVKVEDQAQVDSNGRAKQVVIISNLNGTLQSQEESKRLMVNFDAFEQDPTKTSPQMVKANYSDDQIKLLLLPDFIKSMAGIGKAEGANGLVADYLNSRIQSLLFRNLERGIESALGLESLTLGYNFGSDIRRALGVQDTGVVERTGFGVGFVKGFFDKLYIGVRYSQDIGQQQVAGQQSTFLNYQVTYKLSPIWSVAYYREPANIYDLNSGYYKTTLNAGYSF